MRICKAMVKLPWLPAVWLGLRQWEGLSLTTDSPCATGSKKETIKRDFKVWKLSCPLGRQVCACPSYPRRSCVPAGQGMGNVKAFFRHSHKPALQSPCSRFWALPPTGACVCSFASHSAVGLWTSSNESPGSLLEKKDHRPHPSPTKSESAA